MTPRGVRFTASAKVWNSVIFSIDWRKDGRALIERRDLAARRGGGIGEPFRERRDHADEVHRRPYGASRIRR